MATVSSNILAVYVFSLHDVFPNIAGHLVSASGGDVLRSVHTDEFMADERHFTDFDRARRWEAKHIRRLLRY